MARDNERKKKRTVRCPVCGKSLFDCGEGSDIDVICKNCNTQLTITTKGNRIMVCEADQAYKT